MGTGYRIQESEQEAENKSERSSLVLYAPSPGFNSQHHQKGGVLVASPRRLNAGQKCELRGGT